MIMRQVQEMQEPVVESTELLPLPPQVYALSQFFGYDKVMSLTFPYHARFGSEVKMQIIKDSALFVFSIGGPKQNVKSFLTTVAGSVFYSPSYGSLDFAFQTRLPLRTECNLEPTM